MVTPGRTQVSKPIHTFDSMRTGRASTAAEAMRNSRRGRRFKFRSPSGDGRRHTIGIHQNHVPRNQRVIADENFRVADNPRAVHECEVAELHAPLRPDIEHRAEIRRSSAAILHTAVERSLRKKSKAERRFHVSVFVDVSTFGRQRPHHTSPRAVFRSRS